jgi:hypothetical protein
MTTFTTEDRELAECEPVPFFGWIDKEDTEMMLRNQLQVMQAEIQRLRKKLMEAGINE